ncbi:hypothetical protein AMTRI_Chr03g145950 [Amborella trichopoda]
MRGVYGLMCVYLRYVYAYVFAYMYTVACYQLYTIIDVYMHYYAHVHIPLRVDKCIYNVYVYTNTCILYTLIYLTILTRISSLYVYTFIYIQCVYIRYVFTDLFMCVCINLLSVIYTLICVRTCTLTH